MTLNPNHIAHSAAFLIIFQFAGSGDIGSGHWLSFPVVPWRYGATLETTPGGSPQWNQNKSNQQKPQHNRLSRHLGMPVRLRMGTMGYNCK